MLRLNYLVLLASLLYILVIGGGVFAFRFWVSYPDQLLTTHSLYQSDQKSLELAILERQLKLRANLDEVVRQLIGKPPNNWTIPAQANVSAVAIVDSSFNIHTIKTGSLWLSESEALNAILKRQLPSMNRVNDGYLSGIRGPLAFALKAIPNTNYFVLIVDNLSLSWLQAVQEHIHAQIRLDTEPNPRLQQHPDSPARKGQPKQVTQYLLQNPIGELVAVIQIQHKLPPPRFWDTQTVLGMFSLILLPLAITGFVHWLFVIPIVKMIRKIQLMGGHPDPTELDMTLHIYELDAFKRAFNKLVDRINRHQSHLLKESLTDGLTGIPNRRAFNEQLTTAWHFCARTHIPLAIVIVDIDYFKRYNDEYGHQKGDDALKAVALCLRSCCRRASEFVGRYGGEEFAFIIQGMTIDELEHFLEHTLQTVAHLKIEHAKSDVHPYLSLSAGATLLESSADWHQNDMPNKLVNKADKALYFAKSNGRNQYKLVRFSESHT